MKKLYVLFRTGYLTILPLSFLLNSQPAEAQSCPLNGNTSISSYPNTYYPATANVAAGSKSITLGAAKYGATPISSGDILLIIQMQGAQLNIKNSNKYGDNTGSGSGYLTTSLMAGNMEYVVASNSVPLTGGTLNTTTGLVNSYQNSAYGAFTGGQYTYQIIRVPTYYDLTLIATITAPRWDGAEGGVLVLYATHNINMNGQTVDASGRGFRGGGGRSLNGAGSGSNTDYYTLSTKNANGSKGEGIAGTPNYVNDSDQALYSYGVEGYPSGSYGMGAPGNAGGGGTDGNPSAANDQNTGGGGGGNGGTGGQGGNAWSTGVTSGGRAGSGFAQVSPSRLVMGGGGGAGTTNNATGTPVAGFASSGAAGGGIIIMWAGNSITGSGSVLANGAAGNSTVQNDGAGGGGAGGSILIYSNDGNTRGILAQAVGGNGGSNEVSGGPSHGPGGGGGGGVIYSNGALVPSSSVSGGVPGTTNGTTSFYGAQLGSVGSIITNMSASAPATLPLSCWVLPVSFLDVSAANENGVVNVSWTVAREVNTLDYLVERSSDGVNFTAIGSTPYQNSTGADNNYQYADISASSVGGTLYYRIRERETGGQSVYSKVVSVRLNSLSGPLAVYPNPAQSFASVSFDMAAAETVSVRLFDMKGDQLWMRQFEAQAGMNTVQIDAIQSLPEGVYLLQWSDGLKPQIVKVLVRH
jgi:hypothetical protein